MKRRSFLKMSTGLSMSVFLNALPRISLAEENQNLFTPLSKTLDEWRGILAPERYSILFDDATEQAWSSPLNHEKGSGTFVCAACFLPLFSSSTKYDSKTGWPSFWRPIHAYHISTKRDFKLIFPRTEYHCKRCGGHQGHVFNDGPKPTRLRYCNNGLALLFIPEDQNLPELRT